MKLTSRPCDPTTAPPMLRTVTACVLTLCCMLLTAAPSSRAAAPRNAAPQASSWFIEETGFHASAHANIPCADCHAAQATNPHPRVGTLCLPARASFDRAICLQCHSEVEAGLAKGVHGGKGLQPAQDYTNCVACHNPHYVLPAAARGKGLPTTGDMRASCAVCHAARAALPDPSPEVAACLRCHGVTTGKATAPQGPVMCLHCHGPRQDGAAIFRISATDMASRTHGESNCLTCHTEAARYAHTRQPRVNCLICHTRHNEKTIHDAHTRVTCGACHLAGVTPVLHSGTVDFTIQPKPLRVHAMTLDATPDSTASCARCHNAGSTATNGTTAGGGAVGAANAILPPKGVLCMGCHAATLSVRDTPSQIGLGVFLLACIGLGLCWFSCVNLGAGTPLQRPAETAPHGHAPTENRWLGLCCDVFLQRRLYRESPLRWGVHALIFYPFLFRFVWGVLALAGSLLSPVQAWPWLLLDKNWGIGAFLFDVSGLALLLGLLAAARLWWRDPRATPNAPRHDWLALGLLLGITLSGFLLEGMRIALTGMPAGSGYAFAGYALALGFAPLGQATLASIYSWGWYAHAVLTALTVAYIPCSQLRHIFTTPLFLLVQAMRGRH